MGDAMEPIITLTDSEYWQLSNAYAGLCLSCGELDECARIEPDARACRCNACGDRELYGLEQAMLMGLVEVTEC